MDSAPAKVSAADLHVSSQRENGTSVGVRRKSTRANGHTVVRQASSSLGNGRTVPSSAIFDQSNGQTVPHVAVRYGEQRSDRSATGKFDASNGRTVAGGSQAGSRQRWDRCSRLMVEQRNGGTVAGRREAHGRWARHCAASTTFAGCCWSLFTERPATHFSRRGPWGGVFAMAESSRAEVGVTRWLAGGKHEQPLCAGPERRSVPVQLEGGEQREDPDE